MKREPAFHYQKRPLRTLPFFGFFQAEKNGGSVLKRDASWKKINGVYLNTRWGCWWVLFRRRSLR